MGAGADEPIAIVDVGIGNTVSIRETFRKAGVGTVVLRDPVSLNSSYRKYVLPGVGNFAAFGRALRQSGWWWELLEISSREENRLLGICVGAQILFSQSDESILSEGLNLLEGEVRNITLSESRHVPRVGWDYLEHRVHKSGRKKTVELGSPEPRYYFSHSYCMNPSDSSAIYATSRSAPTIPTIVRSHNLLAVQFHPDRSGVHGERFLRDFAEGVFDVA